MRWTGTVPTTGSEGVLLCEPLVVLQAAGHQLWWAWAAKKFRQHQPCSRYMLLLKSICPCHAYGVLGGVQQAKASGKERVKTWRWDRFLLWLARDLWLQWRLRMRIMPVGTNCILIYYLVDQEPDMAYSKSRVGAGVIGRALASCCRLFGAKRAVSKRLRLFEPAHDQL